MAEETLARRQADMKAETRAKVEVLLVTFLATGSEPLAGCIPAIPGNREASLDAAERTFPRGTKASSRGTHPQMRSP
jgi:hypothetical protein